ncbi:MAG: DUF86 domain-containing protein [Planctomycetota bacterium]|nr:DUF86 domain-containing protein [Planctomycetota bacterium]
MADDVLMQKLVSIDRCVVQVHTFVAGDLDRLKDQLVQDAVVLNLQRACEQAIDAASRVVSTRRLGIPSDSAEAFTILERAGLLSEPTAARMRAMVGFRNIVVHQYQSLNQAVLRAIVQDHLVDFAALCRELSAL